MYVTEPDIHTGPSISTVVAATVTIACPDPDIVNSMYETDGLITAAISV
jgi:hypothetical protein